MSRTEPRIDLGRLGNEGEGLPERVIGPIVGWEGLSGERWGREGARGPCHPSPAAAGGREGTL